MLKIIQFQNFLKQLSIGVWLTDLFLIAKKKRNKTSMRQENTKEKQIVPKFENWNTSNNLECDPPT